MVLPRKCDVQENSHYTVIAAQQHVVMCLDNSGEKQTHCHHQELFFIEKLYSVYVLVFV